MVLERKYGIDYRLVEEEDAEFIVSLRTDKKRSRFLHQVDGNIDVQKKWINDYKKREAAGKEFYFVFLENSGTRAGLTRLYNINAENFTLGSWIFKRDAPHGSAILADIIARETGFHKLEKQVCLFDVRKKNLNVIQYHMKYKPEILGEDDENIYFSLKREHFEAGKLHYLKFLKKIKESV